MKVDPIQALDIYKVGHIFQYPKGTEMIYSNFTPRSNKLAPKVNGREIKHVVFFGLQGFILTHLVESFNENFFKVPLETVLQEYRRMTADALGEAVDVSHIEALHNIGYLPLEIKALPEGSLVPMGVPVFTVKNTRPNFFWLVNYIETVLSNEIWKPTTVATIALEYRKILTRFAKETGAPLEFVDWQGHDFSMRGMSGIEDAAKAGAGHLTSFLGSDTVPAMNYLRKYYNGDKTFVGGSVPATEHSVMCAGGQEGERDTIKRLITEVYPGGVVSIVSDTWDFWNTITVIAPSLKEEILSRKPNAIGLAKVVFRPDSGDPVKIICGDPDAEPGSPEFKGAVQCLWDSFGGTETANGYKILNERVGLIYGDSITLQRAEDILQGLKDKGFASCNIVFGIGSFTYQYMTRDTFGFAMKATAAVVNGEFRELFKDPKTGASKKSAKGLLRVLKKYGEFVLEDQLPNDGEAEDTGELDIVFHNGTVFDTDKNSLENIRARIKERVSY